LVSATNKTSMTVVEGRELRSAKVSHPFCLIFFSSVYLYGTFHCLGKTVGLVPIYDFLPVCCKVALPTRLPSCLPLTMMDAHFCPSVSASTSRSGGRKTRLLICSYTKMLKADGGVYCNLVDLFHIYLHNPSIEQHRNVMSLDDRHRDIVKM